MVSRAFSARSLFSANRPSMAVSSPVRFSTLSRRAASIWSKRSFTPWSRSTSSSAARCWAWAVLSSYWAASSSRRALSSAVWASRSLACRASVRLRSFSSSAARLRTPALRLTEPPVMEPPRLMTWPSSVTMRKALRYFRAMAMPQSRSSAMTVLPRRF